jgi:hypothetical protein
VVIAAANANILNKPGVFRVLLLVFAPAATQTKAMLLLLLSQQVIAPYSYKCEQFGNISLI